jgi:phosphopantothenoylcysteine synthetase/decarboxylase
MSKKQRGGGFLSDCVGALCSRGLNEDEKKIEKKWNEKAARVESSIADIDKLVDRLCQGFNIRKRNAHLTTRNNLSRQASILETGPYKELLDDYAKMSDKVQSVLERKHHSIQVKMSYLIHHAIPAVDLRCSGFDTQGSS